jgi:hypothetical protein
MGLKIEEGGTGAKTHADVLADLWMPIETAPKDGTRIMLADATDVETGQWVEAIAFPNTRTEFPAGWEDDRYDAAHVFEPGFLGKQPTHWMPLPPPPVDKR